MTDFRQGGVADRPLNTNSVVSHETGSDVTQDTPPAPASGAEEASYSDQLRQAIDAGLKAFCTDTPDFDMSPAMRRAAADFILGQPLAFAARPAGEGVSLRDGEWFYPEGDHSSDECRFSPDEVIDYALEGETVSRVVCIERAASLPSVYAAVRVWSDAEKDERQSDNDYDYTLYATAEEARAALTEGHQP